MNALAFSTILATRVFRKHFRVAFKAQDLHISPVSRLGGLALTLSMVLSLVFVDHPETFALIVSFLVPACVAFSIGILDDIRGEVSRRVRVLCVVAAGVLAGPTIGWINHIDLLNLSGSTLMILISIFLTVFGAVAVTNAFNLIDGLNGLSSGVAIMILCGLLPVAQQGGEGNIEVVILLLVASTLGFFIQNFPYGRIFLGDCGAYFLGFIVFQLCVYLNARILVVSSWFYLVLCAYPIAETIFSVMRRKSRFGEGDDEHLHHLTLSWVSSSCPAKGLNSRLQHTIASIFCLVYASLAVSTAVLCRDNAYALIFSFFAYLLSYLWIYKFLSNKRSTIIQ